MISPGKPELGWACANCAKKLVQINRINIMEVPNCQLKIGKLNAFFIDYS